MIHYSVPVEEGKFECSFSLVRMKVGGGLHVKDLPPLSINSSLFWLIRTNMSRTEIIFLRLDDNNNNPTTTNNNNNNNNNENNNRKTIMLAFC